MKSLVIMGLLLLILSACNKTESIDTSNNNVNQDRFSEVSDKDMEDSPLALELNIEDIMIHDSVDNVIGVFGNPPSDQVVENSKLGNAMELLYDQNFFLTKETKVIGFTTHDPKIMTKSGIKINDSLTKLLEVYDNRRVLKSGETYYLYDDQFILTFDSTDMNIDGIGLFELNSYLSMVGLTIEDLLLESEVFEEPIVEDEEILDDTTQDPVSEESLSTSIPGEVVEERNDEPAVDINDEEENSTQNYFDLNISPVAAFSKTVTIGDDESIVRDYFLDDNNQLQKDYITINEDEIYNTYDYPPVRIITREGKIKFMGWGRSGSFEDWKTKEGIGRRSTLEETIDTYQGYAYKLLYRQGLDSPSYMIVDYHQNLLVFEFNFDAQVSLIFHCTPEMIDEMMIKNSLFTFDHLEEQPF